MTGLEGLAPHLQELVQAVLNQADHHRGRVRAAISVEDARALHEYSMQQVEWAPKSTIGTRDGAGFSSVPQSTSMRH